MTDLLAAARVEAARLQHDYVGTEHLVLALIQTGDPSLSTILSAFASTPAALRERLEKRSPQGKGAPANLEEIALRSGAKRALDAARTAAQGREPGPQELLGALMAEQKGVVSASLGDLGIPVAKVREALGIEAPASGGRAGTDKPPAPSGRRSRNRRRSRSAPRRESDANVPSDRRKSGPEMSGVNVATAVNAGSGIRAASGKTAVRRSWKLPIRSQGRPDPRGSRRCTSHF